MIQCVIDFTVMKTLTGAQRSILSVIVAETTKQVFSVFYGSVLDHGYVATEKALSLNIK